MDRCGARGEARERPEQGAREAWLLAAREPYTEDERPEARGKIRGGLLDRMKAMLAQGPWLLDQRYSIGDITAVPFVKRIDEEIARKE